MILVDTSVWIDFFSSSPGPAGQELRRMIDSAQPPALTGLVVAEVLQGITRDVEVIQRYLALWDMLEPRGPSTHYNAAAIFRNSRAKGVSLTTVDVLIAAVAIEHGAQLFTLDKDFTRIAQLTRLKLYSFS